MGGEVASSMLKNYALYMQVSKWVYEYEVCRGKYTDLQFRLGSASQIFPSPTQLGNVFRQTNAFI